MRSLYALLLCLLLVPCVGCGGTDTDTSHREDPDFVDTSTDPTANVPDFTSGDAPAQPPGGARRE